MKRPRPVHLTPAALAQQLLAALPDPFTRFGLHRASLERWAAGKPCTDARRDDMRIALAHLEPKERKKLRIEELEERTKEVHRARQEAGEHADPRADVA